MKNKLWKQWMMSGLLVSAMVVSCGVSVSVLAEETTEAAETATDAEETDSSAENEDDLQILFDQAVEDAMIAEDGEILPVVSLDEGEPYAVYDEEGRVLLYTFHHHLNFAIEYISTHLLFVLQYVFHILFCIHLF